MKILIMSMLLVLVSGCATAYTVTCNPDDVIKGSCRHPIFNKVK